MRRVAMVSVLVTAAMMWTGCGAATEVASDLAALEPAQGIVESSGAEELASLPLEEATVPAMDASMLPASPWSEAALAADVVPAPIVSAWAHAENRTRCAPLAPRALGAGEGARARVAELEGGWAVEFDRRGMPGLGTDGETCARCGRGVFGIAGTNLTPEDLVTEESTSSVPTPSFADGSHMELEAPAEGEQVAAATLTVSGQACVYQVWSFLGEAHVRELVSSLRLVDVQPSAQVVASR